VVLADQLVPRGFAHALHHLVDQLDLSTFDTHYSNDTTGTTARSSAMLLNAVLM